MTLHRSIKVESRTLIYLNQHPFKFFNLKKKKNKFVKATILQDPKTIGISKQLFVWWREYVLVGQFGYFFFFFFK